MPALSSGDEEVEGAVPEATFFLNAAQCALKPPLIWTDLELRWGRDGMFLAVAGTGRRGNSATAEWSERSFAVVVVVWRGFGGIGLEGAAGTGTERLRLKYMPGPSPLGTVAGTAAGHRGVGPLGTVHGQGTRTV